MTTAFGDNRWIRERLGSTGRPRTQLIERLFAHVPRRVEEIQLGLNAIELERTLPRHEAELLGATTSRVGGDSDRLQRILWWGTALADLPAGADGDARAEGGRFNLAFALFDSVVDESPRSVSTLACALAPERLRARMAMPDRHDAGLTVSLPELEPLVRLFDVALADVGRRLRDEPARVDQLGDLLEMMFRSELQTVADPFLAKTLPVVFIGTLVDARASTARLFHSLSDFLWLWDDWLDIAEDLRYLRPNAFLGRAGSPIGRATACMRGAVLLAAGSMAHNRATARLERAFLSTLDAASELGAETLRRTVAFQRELLA